MILGAPVFLFALGALLVPIVIHLWSKNTKSQLPFGSTRFLRETVTKTTRQVFPSDLLLLLLRCVLIILLALILAEPFFYQEKLQQTAFLIDPALDENLEGFKNSIPEGADIFWLSETKTPVTESLQNSKKNLWQDYSAYDEYDSLVIFSPRHHADFHGQRIKNDKKVNWIIPPANGIEQVVTMIQKDGINYQIIEQSNESSTLFKIHQAASGGDRLAVTVLLHASEKYQDLASRMRAALQAISNKGLISIHLESYTDTEGRIDNDAWVIWLNDENPQWRRNLLYLEEDQRELIRKVSGGIYAMAPAPTKEMLRQNLPLQLEKILHENLISELNIDDVRVLPEAQLGASFIDKVNVNTPGSKVYLAPVGWIIFVLLLLAERVLSNLKARE